MEFYAEFLLTAAISVLVVFLIGKIASIAAPSDGDLDRSSELQSDPLLHRSDASAPAAAGVSSAEEERLHGEADATAELAGESAQSTPDRSEVIRSDYIELSQEKDGVEIGDESLELVEEKEGKELVGFQEEKDELVEEEKNGIEEEEVAAMNVEEEEEEEWEGIERSELEKLFSSAAAYAGSADGGGALSKLSSDVQMRLYGLHKVATEGPCYGTQPMALKLAVRAKWHAWQRLGNMNPEVAMEQYITLVSEIIPGWMGEKPRGFTETNDFLEAGLSKTEVPSDLKFPVNNQLAPDTERRREDSSDIKEESSHAGPEHFDQGFAHSFLVNLLSPTTLTFLSLL